MYVRIVNESYHPPLIGGQVRKAHFSIGPHDAHAVCGAELPYQAKPTYLGAEKRREHNAANDSCLDCCKRVVTSRG